ncbi:MAG: MFS transporter, partial [Coxiella sp. (in: Bacteria)]
MERKPQFFILYLLVSFASVGAVIISPAMPAIGAYFHLSNMGAKGVLMIYLLGYALGELPYGPLANRFGRKIAVFIGATTASVGAIFCVLSAFHYMYWLLVLGIFIMGLGAAVGLGLALAIIGDSYTVDESARKTSLVTSSFAIMPAIFVV